MQVGRRIIKYDLSLTDKDIDILIECIRKSRLSDCRDQMQAWNLLDGFVQIFLDDNREKYINTYLTEVEMFLKHNHKIDDGLIIKMLEKTRECIDDNSEDVFHFDSEDWADRLVRSNVKVMAKKFEESIVNQEDCINSEMNYRQQMIDSVFNISEEGRQRAIQRNKRCSELLGQLRK